MVTLIIYTNINKYENQDIRDRMDFMLGSYELGIRLKRNKNTIQQMT